MFVGVVASTMASRILTFVVSQFPVSECSFPDTEDNCWILCLCFSKALHLQLKRKRPQASSRPSQPSLKKATTAVSTSTVWACSHICFLKQGLSTFGHFSLSEDHIPKINKQTGLRQKFATVSSSCFQLTIPACPYPNSKGAGFLQNHLLGFENWSVLFPASQEMLVS